MPTAANPTQRTREVLVLGTDTRVILAVTRSLGRQGIRVHLGWAPADSIARLSRYVHKVHEIPAYDPQSDDWKRTLIGILESHQFDLVIPCNDSTVVPLQVNRAEFERFTNIYRIPTEVFDVAFDKFRTYELAEGEGVCLPKSEVVRNGDADPRRLIEQYGLPVILKPRATVTVEEVAESNVVRKARSLEELEALLATPPYSREVLVQENFVGTGVGVEILAHEGEILTAFQHVRLHETVEVGSSYRKSSLIHPELHEAVRRMVRKLNYSGVAMFEFIFDFTTGRWVFLEINARFWGSLPLAVAAGADFPWYLYQYVVDRKREFPQQYRLDARCRNLLLDYRGMRNWARSSHGGFASMLTAFGSFLRVACFRDHLDSFAIDDFRPGLSELAYIGRMILGKMFGRFRPHAEVANSTPVLEKSLAGLR
jgi:predicted ATP-grasp superfamily ATP-dependent carboligase